MMTTTRQHELIGVSRTVFKRWVATVKEHVTTADVARLVGVSRVTLEKWLTTGKLKEPQRLHRLRIWTPPDIYRVVVHVKTAKLSKLRGRPLGRKGKIT